MSLPSNIIQLIIFIVVVVVVVWAAKEILLPIIAQLS